MHVKLKNNRAVNYEWVNEMFCAADGTNKKLNFSAHIYSLFIYTAVHR